MDLYLDFDGVLLDTINVSYKMMEELGIDLKDRTKVTEFYKNLDWVNLLNISEELSKSFYYINEIYNEHIFNPRILTTVNSLNEMKAKIEYIRTKNNNISVICVPNGINKCKVVNATNSFLVDDYSHNLINWEQEGGIGIKFSNKQSDNFITTNSLDIFTKNKLTKKLIRRLV